MPDFDIDFCERGRDRVIEYVKQKYGAQSVSQIATFGTMAARAVVRDVGRVMEWSYTRTDELAKLIPFQPGKRITLADAREMEPRLKEREKTEEETRELLALAEQLEGLARNVGMHAGGVLIAPGKLTEFCPLYAAQGTESTISQFDMKDVERVGLVKFDFLGLTTLTVLDWAVQSIRAMGQPEFSLDKIPLDDPRAYSVFANANTTAIFQFESRGMRDLVKRARPDRFEDIIALVALYRPGPMELIPEFVERKNGKRVEYLDPRLEPILKPTYGIMVYQEQVMQIAQVIGGYSLGGADLLRRAMGKKDAKEMAQQRDVFVAGAEKNKLPRAKAILLFDLMEKFAGYGFNKSHAAAYALIAYQTAYLKAHHPAAFMAANLSAVMDDTDKVHQFHEDALANGLKVLPPDINAGVYRFVPVDTGTIRYGLGAVKGTGESAIGAILAARQAGAFRDLFDFCARVDKRTVNRRTVEALVRAGAFDCLEGNDHARRASLLASVGVALDHAEQAERHAKQTSLFGAESGEQHKPALVAAAPWTESQRLREEKLALGFYLSGHPFSEHRAEIGRFVKANLRSLAASAESEGTRTQLVAGVVESIRFQRTQQGRMVIVNLSDGTASQELTVYNEVFDQYRDLVKEDAVIVAEAKVRSVRRSVGEEGEAVFTRITAERIYDVAGARSRFARGVRLSMNGEVSNSGAAATARLKSLLEPYRNGPCPVAVRYKNGGASVEMQLGDSWRVNLDEALMASLREWLKPENVEVLYP
jgi:DNA polymerase-3 subunit alpha